MAKENPNQPTVQLPLSPPLMECMDLLKEVRTKMNTYNNSNGSYHDAITESYNKIECGINSIAWALSEIMRHEIVDKYFNDERKEGDNE